MTLKDNSRGSKAISIIAYFIFDLALSFFDLVVHTFFRDIRSRGSCNIPRAGPVIFVVAPHHNQFIDAVIVMSKVRELCGRHSSLLIANKSYKRPFIGTSAKLCGAIPVERAQDLLKLAQGKIFVDKDDNLKIIGEGTEFTKTVMVKGLLGLPHSLGSAQVQSIEDDTHLTLKKPFKLAKPEIQEKIDDVLSNGTAYKVAPHIDNNKVFSAVFNHLNSGKVLGIFPEGGLHDRPDLLPLKPGVAIMALGAVASQLKETDDVMPVQIVPVGLNYFHPHKFRSRVVVEFGKPIAVGAELAQAYNKNSREVVGKLLDTISMSLKEVTVTCDDFDTLMVLQAARRLYTSGQRENIPIPLVVEMDRRLVKGYTKYADEPDIIELKEAITKYNKLLHDYGLHDHQVESLNSLNRLSTAVRFLEVLLKCAIFTSLSLPGAVLFSPVFITAHYISRKKAKEALEASTVKLKAKDVLGTWKILVALALAPCLYIFYSVIGTILIKKYDLLPFSTSGYTRTTEIFAVCYAWAVFTTYASLRVGELGVDQYKTLIPLFISILSHHMLAIQTQKLKEMRRDLSHRINSFCHKYGPDMFEDYDRFYREYNNDESDYVEVRADDEGLLLASTSSEESVNDYDLNNLADVQIFSSTVDDDIRSVPDDKADEVSHSNDRTSPSDSGNGNDPESVQALDGSSADGSSGLRKRKA